MNYGVTFSHRFIKELELDPEKSLLEVTELCFDFVRLCVYWDESQPHQSEINLEAIKRLLNICQKAAQKVVLTVGMKAPRWPEFYFPEWVTHDPDHRTTQQQFLHFLQQVIPKLADFDCIKYWQVENEPLDPSGPQFWKVPETFLQEEVQHLRALDSRPIFLTAWGNELGKRKLLPKLAQLADVVGIDLYDHQYNYIPFFGPRYVGPKDSDRTFRQIFDQIDKPIWIAELQAEPWERGSAEYRSEQPQSMSVATLQEHVQHAQKLGVETAFFWGVEYWLWRKAHGDSSYINFWRQLCGI